MRIGGRDVQVTHPDRVLFPEEGITKGEVIAYYHRLAGRMLPHLRGRPITMVRLHGRADQSFMQKAVPAHFPAWIARAEMPRKAGGTTTYARCEEAAALVYMANQGALTFHVWLSRVDRPECPDRLVLDLDPPGEDFAPVRHAARAAKVLLEEVGLTCFALATGSRGLHLVAPLEPMAGFDDVRETAQTAAEILARQYPQQVTDEARVVKRRGRVFLDTARNGYAQTVVAPYSVRSGPGAPVAMPVTWREIDRPEFTARQYRMREVMAAPGRRSDPWRGMTKAHRPLRAVRQRLEEWRAKR